MAKKPSIKTGDVQLDVIQYDIAEIKEIAKENRIALVGKEGTPGLIGNFNVLCQRVTALETLLHNDIAHLQAKMDLMFNSRDVMTNLKISDNVTWGSLLKDWLKPVITSILTAILIYFIVTRGMAQ